MTDVEVYLAGEIKAAIAFESLLESRNFETRANCGVPCHEC